MFRTDKMDDLFEKLKPVLGEKKVNALWMLYHFDSKQKDFVESLAYLMSAKYLDETFEKKYIFLPPIPREKSGGEYPLGIVYHGEKPMYPFALREDEWIHHLCIFGRSGSGKTTVAFIILSNLINQKKPFLVFDWKRNYRELLDISDNILVFTIGREPSFFYWNPLIPPEGILPVTWLKKLIEILCHAYFLGEGVAYLLMKAIDAVYGKFGVYDNPEYYPTFRDVFEWIYKYKAKGREAQWLDSTKRTLAVLCFGEFGNVINVRNSTPIGEFLNQNIIMELDALTNSDKTFFIEALLLWIHHYRLGQKDRETFKHAILIEEAHHILLKKKQELGGGEAITDVILREIRELGESIILIDQHPSLISKPALGNTYTTIAMNLKHGSDVATLADSILLRPDQREYLGELPIGSAIVKLQGRWFKPFLVKFPPFPLKKGLITDQDVKERMRGYLDKFSKDPFGNEFSEVIRDVRSTDKNTKSSVSLLEKGEKALLEDAVEYPLCGIVERYRRLGLNSYHGNKMKNQLIEKGLAKEIEINTKKGRIKVLQLTSEGYKIIENPESKSNVGRGHPGPEHEYWKKRIAEYYQKLGYQVEDEKPIGNGKSVDLVASNGKENIAIEIETGKSDAIYNIRKDLEAGFDRVVCVPLDEKVKQKTVEGLREMSMGSEDKVKVVSIKELLDSIPISYRITN